MQKVTGIGGVFFRAKDPKSLAEWYENNLGIDVSEKTWVQESGQTVFSPFKMDSDYFGRQITVPPMSLKGKPSDSGKDGAAGLIASS